MAVVWEWPPSVVQRLPGISGASGMTQEAEPKESASLLWGVSVL